MNFETICMLFSEQEPYYGILLSSMDRVATDKISTIGVGRSGNVFKLYYNPDYVGRFNIDTTLGLLKHECLHVAFNSFTIWDGADKTDTKEIHNLRNIAADLEVNCYLNRSKMQKEAGGVWAEDLGLKKCEGTREYFRQLLQSAQNQSQPDSQSQSQQNQNSQQSQRNTDTQKESTEEHENKLSDGSSSGNSQPQISKDPISTLSSFDDHSNWPDEMSEAEMEQLKLVVDDLLIFAAEEVEKGHGTIPGEIAVRIKELRERKPKPAADWKRYLRRHLGNEFSEFIRKSNKRESRRFTNAAGNRHRRKSQILVAIDTSGSVSMPDYREFFGQIKTLATKADVHIVECDTVIQHEYDYRGRHNETLHGGGGTSYTPVINLYNKNKKKYDALVYFTDGYCDIPKDTPKDTLWVISSQGDQTSRKRYKVNGASVAFIPKIIK